MSRTRKTARPPAESGRDALPDGPPVSRPPASHASDEPSDDVVIPDPIAPVGPGGKRSKGPQPVSASQRGEFGALIATTCFTDTERDRWRRWLDSKATSYTCWQMVQWLKRERNRRTPVDPNTYEKPVAA